MNPIGPTTLSDFSTRFISILATSLPLLVLGVFVFAVLEQYAPLFARFIPKRPALAIPLASVAGIVVPVCDCGAIPVAHGLVRRGVGVAPAVAFIIGAPVINPIVFVITASVFGIAGAVARLSVTFVVAIAVALLFQFVYQQAQPVLLHDSPPLTPDVVPGSEDAEELAAELAPAITERNVATSDLQYANTDVVYANTVAAPTHRHNHTYPAVLAKPQTSNLKPQHSAWHIVEHASAELVSMGRYLVIGAFVAALIQTFVPQDRLTSLGNNPITGVLVMMLLAFILSLCALSDAPVAATFLTSFGPGAVLAFLVYGQIIDIKNLFMMFATFRRSVTMLFLVGSTVLVFIVGLLANELVK